MPVRASPIVAAFQRSAALRAQRAASNPQSTPANTPPTNETRASPMPPLWAANHQHAQMPSVPYSMSFPFRSVFAFANGWFKPQHRRGQSILRAGQWCASRISSAVAKMRIRTKRPAFGKIAQSIWH